MPSFRWSFLARAGGALSSRLRRVSSVGHPVRPSELAHRLQELAGTDATVERVLVRFADTDAAFSECSDLAIRPADLVVLGTFRPRWSPPADAKGGLS